MTDDADLPPFPDGWTAIPLHPEGAPSPLRVVMGDAAYEAQMVRQAEQWELAKAHTTEAIRREAAKARLMESLFIGSFFVGTAFTVLLLAISWAVLHG